MPGLRIFLMSGQCLKFKNTGYEFNQTLGMNLKQDVAISIHIETTLNKIIINSLITRVFIYYEVLYKQK